MRLRAGTTWLDVQAGLSRVCPQTVVAVVVVVAVVSWLLFYFDVRVLWDNVSIISWQRERAIEFIVNNTTKCRHAADVDRPEPDMADTPLTTTSATSSWKKATLALGIHSFLLRTLVCCPRVSPATPCTCLNWSSALPTVALFLR